MLKEAKSMICGLVRLYDPYESDTESKIERIREEVKKVNETRRCYETKTIKRIHGYPGQYVESRNAFFIVITPIRISEKTASEIVGKKIYHLHLGDMISFPIPTRKERDLIKKDNEKNEKERRKNRFRFNSFDWKRRFDPTEVRDDLEKVYNGRNAPHISFIIDDDTLRILATSTKISQEQANSICFNCSDQERSFGGEYKTDEHNFQEKFKSKKTKNKSEIIAWEDGSEFGCCAFNHSVMNECLERVYNGKNAPYIKEVGGRVLRAVVVSSKKISHKEAENIFQSKSRGLHICFED